MITHTLYLYMKTYIRSMEIFLSLHSKDSNSDTAETTVYAFFTMTVHKNQVMDLPRSLSIDEQIKENGAHTQMGFILR